MCILFVYLSYYCGVYIDNESEWRVSGFSLYTYSKPPDEKQHVRNTLLDILCNIDVVYEIQEENAKVIGVFDNENTIAALFEYGLI